MNHENAARTFAESFPAAGTTQVLRDDAVGEHAASVAIDAHGAGAFRLTAYLVDAAILAAGSAAPDVPALLRAPLEAAAALLGALQAAEAQPAEPGEGAEVYRIDLDGAPAAWLAIEDISVAAGEASGYDPAAVKRIEGVGLDLSVVIGRTRLTVAELLALEPGQALDLDRAAGAPVDVLVNGVHMFDGEVVVLDQDYGVKITRVHARPATL